MDKSDYIDKMGELLADENVYKKKKNGYAKSESEKFNKSARKILKKSKLGKTLLHTLEEEPAPPKMKGLPKVHKPGIPMRPITSGIGSAPHRLAKILAKPLTKVLGSVSDAHLRNSGDLLNRLKELDFTDKKLASFDVKALFTNVPIEGAIKAIEKALTTVSSDNLPLPKNDYLALVRLCLKFNPFVFNDEEYAQHEGLAMGSPLSPVAACLFMEILEQDQLVKIMGPGTSWFRYVDDVLVIVPKDQDLNEKLHQINTVHSNIEFTLEEELNGMIPFLDTMIIREMNKVQFRVFRKSTNKEDYIHFYSAHSTRTKSGIVIGFFLRALRICSDEYVEEEINHIFRVFTKLKYPKALLVKLKKKAKDIKKKKEAKRNVNVEDQGPKAERIYKLLVVPNSRSVPLISRGLRHAGIKVVEQSGTKICDIVMNKYEKTKNERSVVYKIPCGGCSKAYYGETHRGLKTRISEHKRDLKHHRMYNSMVVHAEEDDHLPRWDRAEEVKVGLTKRKRKIVESALIGSMPCTNHSGGFFTLGTNLCNLVLGNT